MPHHLFLPKQSLRDVRALLRLEDDKLRVLDEIFATAASISPRNPNFLQRVSERLHLDSDAAASVVLVAEFLLTVVEEGHPPEEVLSDVRHFVEQHAAEDRNLVTSVDAKRKVLVSLLTPKPERTRALKVRYLQSIHPTAESFRTVCELRPLFDRSDGDEDIIGYVPTVLLEVRQCDAQGDESQLILSLSPASLKDLALVIERAEKKLAAIRHRFGEQLLGDAPQE